MVINTRDFGELTINESDIINFPLGLYGFEDLKRFVLLNDENSDNDDNSILWLQAVDNAFPCLVVLNPADFCEDFSPIISSEDKQFFDTEDSGTLSYMAIAVVNSDVTKTAINLKSPIALDMNKKIGKQILLENDYPIRYFIFSDSRGGE